MALPCRRVRIRRDVDADEEEASIPAPKKQKNEQKPLAELTVTSRRPAEVARAAKSRRKYGERKQSTRRCAGTGSPSTTNLTSA